MANAFSDALGGGDDYQFGIYNAPGIASVDVTESLAGRFAREHVYELFSNSSRWFPPELARALTYLCPENYPANSYVMHWADMVEYNLTKYAYDYSFIVGTAAVHSFPDDIRRLRPVIKSTFEVKDFPGETALSWPFMDLRGAYTAQLCGLYDAGIRSVLVWNACGSTSSPNHKLYDAAHAATIDPLDRQRWLHMRPLSLAPITEADLDAPPPRASLVAKLEARFTDDLVVAESIFGTGDTEQGAEATCAKFH